jgi:hypothetical protein
VFRLPKIFRHQIVLLSLFILFALIQLFVLISGVAWNYLDPDEFSFWMLVIVAILAIVSGVVATYSFVQFTQEGSLRGLVIALLGANVILLAFLYLLTHPVTIWFSLSGRQRNMTIAASLGFLITPGVLGGSLAGHRPSTSLSRNIILLWGVVVQPLVSISFLLSPEPVFVLTGPGFGNLSVAGWILSIVIGVSTSLSLVRYLLEWFRTRECITLASSLALVLWILSFLIYLSIESPIQVAELLWLSCVAEGFILLAVTMIVTSIIDPHHALESLVRQRTIQLEDTRKDTEFYLRLWTHKIGNLLQGITTFLDLIGFKAEEFPSMKDLQKHALDLVHESTTVNRQVENLVRIKENENSVTWPVNIGHFLSRLEEKKRNEQDAQSFDVEGLHIDQQIQVVADDLIDIVFSNLMTKCAKHHEEDDAKPAIRVIDNSDTVQVAFGPCSSKFTSEIKDWSISKPTLKSSVVDLDLFMAWLLMERYGGRIERMENPDGQDVELVLTFRKAS